jgi:hypothetical protein
MSDHEQDTPELQMMEAMSDFVNAQTEEKRHTAVVRFMGATIREIRQARDRQPLAATLPPPGPSNTIIRTPNPFPAPKKVNQP